MNVSSCLYNPLLLNFSLFGVLEKCRLIWFILLLLLTPALFVHNFPTGSWYGLSAIPYFCSEHITVGCLWASWVLFLRWCVRFKIVQLKMGLERPWRLFHFKNESGSVQVNLKPILEHNFYWPGHQKPLTLFLSVSRLSFLCVVSSRIASGFLGPIQLVESALHRWWENWLAV